MEGITVEHEAGRDERHDIQPVRRRFRCLECGAERPRLPQMVRLSSGKPKGEVRGVPPPYCSCDRLVQDGACPSGTLRASYSDRTNG